MKKMLRSMTGFFSRKTRKRKMLRRMLHSESGPVGGEYILIGALVSAIIIGLAVKYKDYIVAKMQGANPEDNKPAVEWMDNTIQQQNGNGNGNG